MDPAYTMDVDDLFGDAEPVNLQNIPGVVPVKGFAGRIDDRGAVGCCQKIAWSKNGCVACISPDGYTISLKVFFRDAESGKWDLGKNIPLEVPPNREQYPFAHLSWSHLGNDLAVMDTAGRVMIFSCAMALDRMHFVRAESAHPEAEVDAVVGMHWLAIHPYEAKNQIAWSTTREGSKWQWHIKSHVFNDAFHPIEGKASLIYLKRHGELKLRFQQNDSSWQEVSAQLGPVISTKEPFRHAAFASNNDGSLLLAAYDVGRRLHLYRVEVTWNVPAEKKNPSTGPFDKPGLSATLISIEDDCSPVNLVSNDLSNGINSTDVAAAQLTHLNFLPITPEQDDGSLPTVQAVFCCPPDLISMDPLQPQEPPHSVIVRWEVHSTQQAQLHPSLDQVTSKKKSVVSVTGKKVFKLKRQADLMLHASVLATYPLWYNMLLAFAYSDGTIEIRKRSTMETIMPDGNTDTMSSLLQAGFVFPHAEASLHVAFSPNHCIAVCMQHDGSVKLRSIEYQHGSLAADDDDPRHSAALAALVLQSASAANQYFSSDDVLSIIGPMTEKRQGAFLALLLDGLQVNIDCGVDDTTQPLATIGRSPFFVKTLSAMNVLGLQNPTTRSLTSKLAWIVLNVKYVTNVLHTVARMHNNIEKNSLKPDVVPLSIGIARWIMHFMAYILDQLFTLGRAVQDIPSAALTKATLEKHIHTLNNPSILFLLSAFPRAMLQSSHKPLQWIKLCAETYMKAQPLQPPEMRRIYTPLHAAVNEIPFEYRWFETLLGETQNAVRAAYKKANLSDTQRNNAERDLLLGRIPDVLLPVAKHLVTDALWKSDLPGGCLADKLDAGRLMFFDTTWLGFQESKRAAQWHGSHVVDVCQKMVIRGVGRQEHPSAGERVGGQGGNRNGSGGGEERKVLRKCVRCGSCMEDVTQGAPGYTAFHTQYLMGVAKHCICGISWMLAEETKVGR